MNEERKKLQLILSKEEVNPEKIDAETVVIVFDVLLATTTIATVLHYGATEVIPVMDSAEALKVAENFAPSTTIVTGEYAGFTIEGFVDPLPTHLKAKAAGKTIILSTTNGTVAIRKVTNAGKIFAASLVNAEAVARKVAENDPDKKILLVCAGGHERRFAMEDFYGAGCFIDQLMRYHDGWELSDAASTAWLFYQSHRTESANILKMSKTGEMMNRMGLEKDVHFASEENRISVVPQFKDGKLTLRN